MAVGLSGCATYAPAPLDDTPHLAGSVETLTVRADELPAPELRDQSIDLSQPLDMETVAILAVAHNPDLKAVRQQAGIVRSEAIAAGLLPNPQLSADYGFLTSGPGVIAAFTIGLVQEILPLLTRSSRKTAARAALNGAELDLLWQEWQVISQARLLVIRMDALRRQRALTERNRGLFADRYRHSRTAMDQGNQTLITVASDLTALNGVETQLQDLDQQLLKARFDLDALIGLQPDVDLRLAAPAALTPLDEAPIRAALPDLVRRRPDLLALKAAYSVQEEKLRQAVILQFPALGLGTARARDTSNVKTQSLTLSLALPLFDRNQGPVAVEQATREKLKAEYQARVDAAYAAVVQALIGNEQLLRQYQAARDSTAELRQAATEADRAFRAGRLDERSFADLQASLLSRETEIVRLELAIRENQVGVQTLIGSDLPAGAHKDERDVEGQPQRIAPLAVPAGQAVGG